MNFRNNSIWSNLIDGFLKKRGIETKVKGWIKFTSLRNSDLDSSSYIWPCNVTYGVVLWSTDVRECLLIFNVTICWTSRPISKPISTWRVIISKCNRIHRVRGNNNRAKLSVPIIRGGDIPLLRWSTRLRAIFDCTIWYFKWNKIKLE